MVQTIFRNTVLVGSAVVLVCAALVFGLRYSQIKQEAREELAREAVFVREGIDLNGIAYLEAMEIEDHVTLLDGSGTVLYDNRGRMEDAGKPEAPEFRTAREKGEGYHVRRNPEGGLTMYCAFRCDDGNLLRIGRALEPVKEAFTFVGQMIWVVILVFLLAFVLSFRAANQIVKPINAMNLDDPEAVPYPELAPLVNRIREQNQTIREETEQRGELRREFSANVSHELKTPLTSISGFAELMQQGLVPQEKVQEFAGDIYRESQRLINLVDDIIRLSKLDENAIPPEWEDVDLYELTSDLLDSLRPVAERQNVLLHLEGDHAVVRGIRRLLSEMVFNLCDNAVKYNRWGGTVTVTVKETEEGAALSVADTGIGIPKDQQDRVFERFYRVDKSHSRELGGTGLGLSIVKHGAQFHDATVSLESEPGEGTTITLKFPAKESEGEV
jgi:two-component system phosphate regulon sensor histidine kinase PhoR